MPYAASLVTAAAAARHPLLLRYRTPFLVNPPANPRPSFPQLPERPCPGSHSPPHPSLLLPLLPRRTRETYMQLSLACDPNRLRGACSAPGWCCCRCCCCASKLHVYVCMYFYLACAPPLLPPVCGTVWYYVIHLLCRPGCVHPLASDLQTYTYSGRFTTDYGTTTLSCRSRSALRSLLPHLATHTRHLHGCRLHFLRLLELASSSTALGLLRPVASLPYHTPHCTLHTTGTYCTSPPHSFRLRPSMPQI